MEPRRGWARAEEQRGDNNNEDNPNHHHHDDEAASVKRKATKVVGGAPARRGQGGERKASWREGEEWGVLFIVPILWYLEGVLGHVTTRQGDYTHVILWEHTWQMENERKELDIA